MADRYTAVGSLEEWEKLAQNQALLSRPTKEQTAKTAAAAAAKPKTKITGQTVIPEVGTTEEWRRLGGIVPDAAAARSGTAARGGAAQAGAAQQPTIGITGGKNYSSLGNRPTDKYGEDIAKKYDQLINGQYSSPYDSQAADLYAQIMGRQPYQSQYGDQIADLYKQIANAQPYQSQYAGQIADLYGDLTAMQPYQSQYEGQISDLYNRLANREGYQSEYGDQARALFDRLQNAGPFESQQADRIADLMGQIEARGEYASPYEQQIKNLYDTIINRPKFSYDANKDPLYQQYREQYARGGQQAMRDTMGASAALTGGYGNSWGNTAGYQAYQNYMAALNDKIPELSQQAFDRYQQEGSDLTNQLALAQAMDEQGYSRWQDAGNALNQRLSQAMTMDDRDYNRYMQDIANLRQNLSAAQAMDEAGFERYQQEGNDLAQRLNTALALDEQGYNRYQQDRDNLRQNLSTAMAMDEDAYNRYQNDQDALRQRLSTAMALDEDAYNRYMQAGDELRQNYNAAVNRSDADWQRWLQQQGLLGDQIDLANQLRTTDLQYQAASGEIALPYLEQMQQMVAAMQGVATPQQAAALAQEGTVQTPASSNFNYKEWLASKAGVKAGQLKKNESPLTTLGSPKASNQWYNDFYAAQEAAANQKKSTGSTKAAGTTKTTTTTTTAEAPEKMIQSNSPLAQNLENIKKKRGL